MKRGLPGWSKNIKRVSKANGPPESFPLRGEKSQRGSKKGLGSRQKKNRNPPVFRKKSQAVKKKSAGEKEQPAKHKVGALHPPLGPKPDPSSNLQGEEAEHRTSTLTSNHPLPP